MSSFEPPARGDIWLADLNPTRGHEQAGIRPVLVISADTFNSGPAGLVVVIPLTTRLRDVPLHVQLDPPEGGLQRRSAIKCEDIRSISAERLAGRWGVLSSSTMALVEDNLRIFLHL